MTKLPSLAMLAVAAALVAAPALAAPPAPAPAPAAAPAAKGDPAKGAKVFVKCQACHAVGPAAKPLTGPPLNGIVDRKIATFPGFKYSAAMTAYAKTAGVWNNANLTAYLTAPKKTVPGGTMSFVGIKKPGDVADLIAYLATQKTPAGK